MTTASNRTAITISIMLLTLTLASVAAVDKPLALYVQKHLLLTNDTTEPVILYLETIFGFGISKYLFGFLAIAIGAAVYFSKKKPDIARIFFFIGITHIISRLVAGILKNIFLRPRPFEWLSGNEGDFFTSGSSFPSGHAAHFFGLFLPIVFLYRRFAWLLIIPAFVGLSRITANHHYLGDVLASVTIAFLFTWVFAKLFRLKTRPPYTYAHGALTK